MEPSEKPASRVIEIRDPEIDGSEVLERARAAARDRARLAPGFQYELDALRSRRRELREAIGELRRRAASVGDLGERVGGWRGRVVWLAKRVVSRLARRHLDQQAEVNAAVLGLLERMAATLEDTARVAEEGELRLATRLHRLSREAPSTAPPASAPDAPVPSAARVLRGEGPTFDYFSFERKFRGSFEEIQRRQREYLPRIELPDAPVLDLGCGRGEFVELLRDEGVAVRGVDLNEDSVAYARERGLPVERGDAFEVLGAAADDSLGGVVAFHVIEHLEPPRLLELLSLAYRKLKPGGFLLLETPNPQCLLVFAESFYLDFTHVRPVHPLTLEHLLEELGFARVELVYSSPATELRLPPLRGDLENLREFNEAVARVNRALFGFRDYAAIATR